MYAGEYKERVRSDVMIWQLADVGSTRYRTGTSGIVCLVVLLEGCISQKRLGPLLAGDWVGKKGTNMFR
jgi:hypothetical protein